MKWHLGVVICILLLAGSAWGQCLPGQTCPTVSQGWRATLPMAPPTRPGVHRWAPGAPLAPRVRVANPAIVRVWCRDNKGIDGYGTGTIFDRRDRIAYVLTAAHNIDGNRQVSVRVRSTWHGATVKHVDDTWDVAILTIADPGVVPIKLADKAPIRGQSVELSGFGSGIYDYRLGKLTQFVAPGRTLPFEWMEVSAPARIGDSGGPICNSKGQLVGMISASRGGLSVGCCFPRIRAIIRGVLPPYPNRPGVIIPKPIVVMPTPAPTPVQPLTIDYEKLAQAVLAKINLADLRGPAGPEGPPGNDGLTGLTGSAGPTPAIDYDVLVQTVIERLPPQRVEWERLDGTILKQAKPLGEPLRFKSVEIDVRK